jgi:hypothetical protein
MATFNGVAEMVTDLYREQILKNIADDEMFLGKWLMDQRRIEEELTRRYGPLHKPGRREWINVIERNHRRETALVWLQQAKGRPVGGFVRRPQ